MSKNKRYTINHFTYSFDSGEGDGYHIYDTKEKSIVGLERTEADAKKFIENLKKTDKNSNIIERYKIKIIPPFYYGVFEYNLRQKEYSTLLKQFNYKKDAEEYIVLLKNSPWLLSKYEKSTERYKDAEDFLIEIAEMPFYEYFSLKKKIYKYINEIKNIYGN